MPLDVMDTFDVQTGVSGFVVRGEVVPDEVVTYETDQYVIVLTCRERADIDPIVAAYDPDSASSPNAADSRSIARPIVAHLAGENNG